MNEILTNSNKIELRKLGDKQDKISWRIGEIAREEWDRNIQNGGHFHRFQVFTAVAREARCSRGRVEKLFAMAQFYPKDIRQKFDGYKLGHFETAMSFGPEQAPDVLEYVGVYLEDKKELPKVKDLDFLYRREILGQPSTKDLTGKGKPLNKGNALQIQLINLLRLIRGQLQKKPLSEEGQEKLRKGIGLIEEVLPELIDEQKEIVYN